MQTKIRPNLWFDTEAEEAARFYVSVFKNAKMGPVTHYPAVGQETHGKPAGSVMTAEFELDGTPFLALNGGPDFTFNEATSFEIVCEDQAEVDYYWAKLGEGGDPEAQVCGWLKDKFGLSWQVVPKGMNEMLNSSDTEKRDRAFAAMLTMSKLDLAELKKAYEGA